MITEGKIHGKNLFGMQKNKMWASSQKAHTMYNMAAVIFLCHPQSNSERCSSMETFSL
jgi:cytochrome bd-type quinol oxidase subunit 1